MKFTELVKHAINKERFLTVDDYIDFCSCYLQFIETGLQARIVSQNENKYLFFQYGKEGSFNITRPLNSDLLYTAKDFTKASCDFKKTLIKLREGKEKPSDSLRENLTRTIYTLQQSIGATLDGLPAGKSNQARKVNGDLFERLILLLIKYLDVDCVSGTMQVPVKDALGNELFKASYQHDLLLSKNEELKVIMDKFLYNRLTETALPHIAIFLNDVQRKKTKLKNHYGINSTFLSGHFKAYTVKLNPLDGVYYCDIRPNMIKDTLLSEHIKTIDHLFYSNLWELLNRPGKSLSEVAVKEKAED